MTSFYFELPTESGFDYVVMHIESDDPVKPWNEERNLTMRSYRIWAESATSLRLIKDRFYGPGAQIDLKEFMWIKLKSIDYDNYDRT